MGSFVAVLLAVIFAFDMSSMFSGAQSFNGDVSTWDVSQVTNFRMMFAGAYSFSGDLSVWDVSSGYNFIEFAREITLPTSACDALLIGWSQRDLEVLQSISFACRT